MGPIRLLSKGLPSTSECLLHDLWVYLVILGDSGLFLHFWLFVCPPPACSVWQPGRLGTESRIIMIVISVIRYIFSGQKSRLGILDALYLFPTSVSIKNRTLTTIVVCYRRLLYANLQNYVPHCRGRPRSWIAIANFLHVGCLRSPIPKEGGGEPLQSLKDPFVRNRTFSLASVNLHWAPLISTVK